MVLDPTGELTGNILDACPKGRAGATLICLTSAMSVSRPR